MSNRWQKYSLRETSIEKPCKNTPSPVWWARIGSPRSIKPLPISWPVWVSPTDAFSDTVSQIPGVVVRGLIRRRDFDGQKPLDTLRIRVRLVSDSRLRHELFCRDDRDFFHFGLFWGSRRINVKTHFVKMWSTEFRSLSLLSSGSRTFEDYCLNNCHTIYKKGFRDSCYDPVNFSKKTSIIVFSSVLCKDSRRRIYGLRRPWKR